MISHGSKGTNTVYFERTIIHEKFDPFTLFHDIGLIKTKSPMRIGLFEYKVKLPIPSDYFETGTPAVLAGMKFTILNFSLVYNFSFFL